jgi:hypothetical protein
MKTTPRLHQGLDASPLYRFEAQLDPTPIGLTPEGLRITLGFEGRITAGELTRCGFAGARVWGIDHYLLRPDGVGVIDAPKTVSTGDRSFFEHVRAYTLPPAGLELPPLNAILEPGFQWPDIYFAIQGFSTFRSGTPDLRDLDRALARIDGWGNFATGRFSIETRLLPHAEKVAPPAPVAVAI